MVQFWTIFAAAFLASAVEFVEAFTIVLVIGVTVNWRSSFLGMGAAMVALAVIVGIFGVGRPCIDCSSSKDCSSDRLCRVDCFRTGAVAWKGAQCRQELKCRRVKGSRLHFQLSLRRAGPTFPLIEHSTQCRAFDAKMTFQQPKKFPQLISNRPKPLHQHSLERNRGFLNHVATIMQNREAPISFGWNI